MGFACTFAGVTFRPPSPAALAWLEQTGHASLRDVLPRGPVWPGNRFNTLGIADPLPYPKAELGDYFYPVGASRWSVFRGLASAADVAAMQASAWNGTPTACTFTLQCEGGDSSGSLSTKLYLLPPVPVGGTAGTPTVYVVTLVDERYFWHQWQNAGVITCTSGTATWSGLLSQLASQLGITLSYTTPSSNYGSPEPDSALYSNYESPAVLLDAVAANVGCAVVRNLDGTYKLQSYSAAQTARDANRPTTGNNLAGGYSVVKGKASNGAVLPSSVTVVFPKWVDGSGFYEPTTYRGHVLESYGAAYTVQVTAASLGAPYSGYTTFTGSKMLHTTAKARFTLSTDPSPNNLTTCQSLANQLAQDYYDGRLAFLDESFPGVRPWTPEGVSDVFYCWKGNEAYTRCVPPPFNWGASEFQHGFGPLADSGLTVRDDKSDSFTRVTDVEFHNATVSQPRGAGTADVTPDPFTVQEIDGSPSTTTKLKVPNTSLTDNGDGTVTLNLTDATHAGVIALADQWFGTGVKAADALGIGATYPHAAGTLGDAARIASDGDVVYISRPNLTPLPLNIGIGSSGAGRTLQQVSTVDGSGNPTGYFQQENVSAGPSVWRLNHVHTASGLHPGVIFASGVGGGPLDAAQANYRLGSAGKIIAGTKFAVGDVSGVTDGTSGGVVIGGIITSLPGITTPMQYLDGSGNFSAVSAGTITVGSTTIGSGTNGDILTVDGSGKLGQTNTLDGGTF